LLKSLKVPDIGESGLIERITKKIKTDNSVIKGIGDDTAVIKYKKGRFILFTSDMLIEDVHFKRSDSPFYIGHKALGCSISDIAAMGGIPKYALVSLGLPADLSLKFLDSLFKGINSIAKRFKINIVGGDTNRSKKIIIDVSLIGQIEEKNLVLRKGARKGDQIFVTGSLGGSIYKKHLQFLPRLKESRYLVENFKINSMIDISDGLVLDLYRITKTSGVGAVVYEELIPISKDAKSLNEALYMGEDFELLFCLPLNQAVRLMESKKIKGLAKISYVGEIIDKRFGLKLITKKAEEKILEPKGFTHF